MCMIDINYIKLYMQKSQMPMQNKDAWTQKIVQKQCKNEDKKHLYIIIRKWIYEKCINLQTINCAKGRKHAKTMKKPCKIAQKEIT